MKFLKSFFKHPWAIIIACLALTGALGFFMKDLVMDNSIRMFFPKKDSSYARLTQTEDEFGSMLVIGISLEAKGGDILTPEYIQVVKEITDQVKELPNVEDIDSLTHIDYVCNQDGAITASQLIPEEDYDENGTYIGSPEMIMRLKDRLTEWDDMYNRVIVDDSFAGTQLQVTLVPKGEEQIAYDRANEAYVEAKENLAQAKKDGKSAEEIAELEKAVEETKASRKEANTALRSAPTESSRQMKVLASVREITEKAVEGHALNYKLFGEPSLSENSKNFMVSDLIRLIPIVAIVVLITLYLSFHTLDGTLLPLITVLMSAACTCGLMGIFHVTFTLVSSVIPVALIAVGSAYGIHVLTHYYVALDEVEGELTKELYEESIFKGLSEVWKAVILASLTTVVGFISLVTSPIEPLHSFAIFTAVGVAFSLFFAVTFIPSLLLVKSYKKAHRKTPIEQLSEKVRRRMDKAQQRRGGKSSEEASGDTSYKIYHFFCGTPQRLIIFSVCIVVLSLLGFRLLKIDTSLVNYFPKNSEFRQDIDYVDQRFAGTNSIYFNIQGQESGDITNPELLAAVDGMQAYLLENYSEGIGKIVSFTTLIKRVNQVWHDPATAELEDSSSDSSFGEDSDFGSFSDDSFASFGEDSFGADSFGEDSFGFDSFGDDSAEETTAVDFVDPNIAYKAGLEETKTVSEILDLLNRSYINAGGRRASVAQVYTEFEKLLNYKGLAYYEIPGDITKYPVASKEELQGVVNDYMSLLGDAVDRFVDDQNAPSKLRVQCQLRNHSTEITGNIIDAATKYAKDHFPEGYTIEFTGSGEMEYSMTNMIVASQLSSLLISLGSVFIIIALSFKSGWAGLLGAIPLAFTILLNYMVMGFAHINLDLVTSIIASVAVGVGIDYTIHFLETYREERKKTSDLTLVTKNTFRKSGHGIVTNALAVGFGFLVLCLSKFDVLRSIGVLVAIVMFTSSALAMTIIPGILNWFDPKFIRPTKEPSVTVVEDEENE